MRLKIPCKKSRFSVLIHLLMTVLVLSASLKIEADLIVTISGDIYPGNFTFYLYDSKNSQIYSKNFKPGWLSYSSSVQAYMRDLMKDFFKNQ
jgi:hypothetical protein